MSRGLVAATVELYKIFALQWLPFCEKMAFWWKRVDGFPFSRG